MDFRVAYIPNIAADRVHVSGVFTEQYQNCKTFCMHLEPVQLHAWLFRRLALRLGRSRQSNSEDLRMDNR
jgi:hypothetical protein